MENVTFKSLIPEAPEGRYKGIIRPYSPENVARLRGSVAIKHSLAEHAANRLAKREFDEIEKQIALAKRSK